MDTKSTLNGARKGDCEMDEDSKRLATLMCLLVAMAIVGGLFITLIVYAFAAFEEAGHPMINKTITVNGTNRVGVIFDTDNIGYRSSVELDFTLGLGSLIKDHVYNITYFCDGDGIRRIARAADLTPPPPPVVPTQDPTKCVTINGVCR
jgi:hypothetical protein